MTLDYFLTNVGDIGKVMVDAKELNKYAKLYNKWWGKAVQQRETIKSLNMKIEKLEDELSDIKSEELITINLF